MSGRRRLFRPGKRILKPQHRMVLGLLAMSGGAFVLTVLFPPPPEEADEALSAGEAGEPVPSVGTPAPTLELVLEAVEPGTGTLDDAAAQAVAGLNRCAADAAAFAPVDGRLSAVVEVGPAGISRAHVRGVDTLGPEASACLVGALSDAGWPAIAGEPVRVTLPFYVVQPLGEAPE